MSNLDITLEVSRNISFSYRYCLLLEEGSTLVNKEDNTITLYLVDDKLKTQGDTKFNVFPYEDSYLIEDPGIYQLKLIASSLIIDEVPFSLIKLPVEKYNELVKDNHNVLLNM